MTSSTSGALSPTSLAKIRLTLRPQNRALWPAIAASIALVVFLSTLQVDIASSEHPYTTDTGEIQNALPRWGLIHPFGYPLYTATGSVFVTLLRLVGIPPAAGASLFSTLWGIVAVGLLVVLAQELGASGPAAALGAVAATFATSIWTYASLAEVHTLWLAFIIATLIFAVRFGRSGKRRDLLLLTLFITQGTVHHRAVLLVAPAVAVLIYPQWRALWRSLGSVIGVTLLAPLTYLYLPLRVWTGATWVFGSPGTWVGLLAIAFQNRGETVTRRLSHLPDWLARLDATRQVLFDSMLWPLLVLGLVGLGLLAFQGKRREGIGLTLAWVPYLLLALVIWKGELGDGQLASTLPILALAGMGLALILERLRQRSSPLGIAAGTALALTLMVWGWNVRPSILSITRDRSAEAVIALAQQIPPPADSRPTTLTVPWGRDYWALTYAQAYQGQLPGLNLVDHNADFRTILDRGDHLLTPSKTFYLFPLSWWEERLGRLYLASVAPGVIELSLTPPIQAADIPMDMAFDLENGLRIRSASLKWTGPDQLLLTVYWECVQPVADNYSVAVHLVAHDPPQDASDVLAQADSVHPLGGWYPTSRWGLGEIVRDHYLIPVPEGSAPMAVRIGLYRTAPEGGFMNSPWLSLPLP